MSTIADLRKILDPYQGSKEERMKKVIHWAEYVRTHPASDWSRKQNIVINKAIKKMRALKLTPRQYLESKGEVCKR